MYRIVTIAALAVAVTACGSALGRLAPAELGVTAVDGYREARTTARSWDAGARLHWVEGVGISSTGMALPEVGAWRYHFTAPGRTTALVVSVSPFGLDREERAPTSPPGFATGGAMLGESWIDSPQAVQAVLAGREGAMPTQATMLLVPTQPTQWVVTFPEADARRWRVHATTGEVLAQ